MEIAAQVLKQVYFQNTLMQYGFALMILAVGIVLVRVAEKVVLKRIHTWAEKTETSLDDVVVAEFRRSIVPLFYFGAVKTALSTLTVAPLWNKAIDIAGIFLLSILGIRFFAALIEFSLEEYWRKQKRTEMPFPRVIIHLVKGALWGFGIVFLLDNLGFKISTVVAGLGIGGVAVALASQAVLGDLFSYFVILFDRPFVVGDFIIVDGFLGTVEHIGIKTTRIRSLSGEQLVFSNTDLTNARLRNYKRMLERRVAFQIGVVYETPAEKLKIIPRIIKEIIEGVEKTRFDRAHFKSYGAYSLDYEIVYYVLDPDYNVYMDIQQEINLKIYEAFEKEGIVFAYPTQTLYMQKAE